MSADGKENPKMTLNKATIGKRFYPLTGYRYPLSPWTVDSEPFKKEQAWLNKAWKLLVADGLVSFENESERTQVAIRVIALAVMYLDFCEKIFQNPHFEPPIEEWADILGLSTEEVLCNFNVKFHKNFVTQDVEEEGPEFLRKIIEQLADKSREEVFDSLLKGFGDINDFFDSLAEIQSHDHDIAMDEFAWFSEKMYKFKIYF